MLFRTSYKGFLACFAILFLLWGCDRGSQIISVEREDHFSLQIGRLEDQITLFNLEGDRGIRRTGIAMRNGQFYIADGNGGKILRYNSYGDLLFMIYNDETNPPPMSLRPLSEDNLLTRWSVSYPLLEPGEISVDSRQHIYVRDTLPYEKHTFDPESKVLLSNTVLHFDANGRFLESLGREGKGGKPFPIIEKIFSSVRDELAVVCRLPGGWDIYWYDADGNLLYLIQLKADTLPIPTDRDDVFPSMDMIAASPDSRVLYAKIDYYKNLYDESTNTRIGIEQDSSVVWEMDVEVGLWDKPLDVPFYEYSYTEQNRKIIYRIPYSLLGVAKNGRIFFSFPVEGGYTILMMTSETGSAGKHHQGFIRVDDDELQFNAFDLTADGILSGLLVDDWQVKLVWWRTDKLLGDGF